MTINVELLDKTLHRIEQMEAFRREGVDLSERWDQGTWGRQTQVDENVCNTAMCFAGWACVEAGVKLRWRVECECCRDTRHATTSDGRSISATARRLLGLDDEQALELFEGDNSLDMLRDLIAEYKAELPECA